MSYDKQLLIDQHKSNVYKKIKSTNFGAEVVAKLDDEDSCEDILNGDFSAVE